MDYRSKDAPARKADRAALLALALSVLLIRGGEHIALLGEDGRPASGSAALNRMAVRLERADRTSDSLPPAEILPRHAQVVLVGDFLSPLEDVEALVRYYVGSGVKGHVLQIVDPAEETLPFTGRTRFEGLEGEGDMLIGRPESLREDYIARFQAHREGLAHTMRAAGWSFAVHHTDQPAQAALLKLYAAMSVKS